MDDIKLKVKSWVDAITKEKMDGVAREIEEFLVGKLTPTENKAIFKMLLYLSHVAAKCDKTKSKLGLDIWMICRCVCSNMTDIPDSSKFFASIYHISNCLLNMGLYKEALEVADYVLPGRLWKNESSNDAEMYTRIGNMVHVSSLSLLRSTKLTTRKSFDILIALVKYELDITKLAHSSCWRHVLSKILSYCEKIGSIQEKAAQSLKEEFQTAMLTYIGQEKISLEDENKNHTYHLIFRLINEMIVRNINARGIASAEEALPRYFDTFRGCLRNHDEHSRCFNLYERWLTALVKPIKNLSSRTEREIAASIVEHDSIRNSSEDPDAVKWYSYSAIVPIGELLVYWEECAKSDVSQCLTHAINTTMMSFLRAHSDIFDHYSPNNCGCKEPRRCDLAVDAYSGVAMKIKLLAVISRAFGNSSAIFTERMVKETLSLCESSQQRIHWIRRDRCKEWSVLWGRCGVHFYNLGISCESKYQEASKKIYALLLSSFVEFEGLASLGGEVPSILILRDPLPTILHRITSLEYKRGRYDSAMFYCALNGLLSAKIMRTTKETNTNAGKSKVYSTWAFIKNKHPASRNFTILKYLRSQKEGIAKLLHDTLRWEDYDLVKVCLREIEGLANGPIDLASSITAVIDELERLKAPVASYAQGVQWLGYHLLKSPSQQPISNYLLKATTKRETLTTTSFRWRQGHLKFHEFCDRIREINAKTESEMENAVDAEKSPTTENLGESAATASEAENLVPSYSTNRINVITNIASYLDSALQAWKRAFEADVDYKNSLESWEIEQTLEMLIVAGEYARLYDLESLEVQAWKMAFNLARELSDHWAIVYVTGRSLSSQRVDPRWIEAADESVRIMEKSEEARVKEAILSYRLSLSDLYYQNGDVETAKKLFFQASSKLEDNFMHDDVNFLLGVHIRMNQPSLAEDTDDQFKYSEIIVRGLYSLLALEDVLEAPKRGDKSKQLRTCDRVFEFTNNLAPRMNGLLGFPEITAHLLRILKMAQKLGASLRVAECLKSLCYIDLSRAKLDDCEVKLQGLEHILEIEGFDVTMKSELMPAIARVDAFASSAVSSRFVETVRDVGQGDASPVLREKVFATPDFLVHGELCLCFKCTNNRYRHLVFAATHIRAQLFSLRRNVAAALDHFEGAMTIKMNILEKNGEAVEAARIEDLRKTSGKKNLPILRSRRHLEDVEYVAIHLDYCRFLKWAMPHNVTEGVEIALGALELCEKYNMQNHPLYVATNLLLFEYRFENAYGEADFSKFTVPAVDEINVDRFVEAPRILQPDKPISFTTPAREEVEPKTMSVRRRKTPPFLRLKKVPIDLTEEEEEEKEPAISTSPPARTRPIRRRRITETQQDSGQSDAKPERAKFALSGMKFSFPNDEVEAENLVTPKREKAVRKPGNVANTGRTKKIDIFVEEIKLEPKIANSQSESSTRIRVRKLSQRGSSSSQSIDSCASETPVRPAAPTIKIDEVTELLTDLTVKKTRPSRNSRATSTAVKIDEITLSDGACSSSDELETRRVSSRLRKKSQDVTAIPKKNESRSLDHSASNSEDEVVIIKTRSRRRAASTTDKTSATKE